MKGRCAKKFKVVTDDVLRMELREVVQASNFNPFPVDLDDVSCWLAYKLRQRLVTILKSKFKAGEDYIEEPCARGEVEDEYIGSIDDKEHTRKKKFFMSLLCLESFCRFRKGPQGKRVQVMLIEAQRAEYAEGVSMITTQAQVIEIHDDTETTVENSPPTSCSESDDDESYASEDYDACQVVGGDLKSAAPSARDDPETLATSTQADDPANTSSLVRKRTLEDVEEDWAQQRIKMQRVMDIIDSPLDLVFLFGPIYQEEDATITLPDSGTIYCEESLDSYYSIEQLLNL